MVKALRRTQINTIEAANRFLEQTYLHEHNARFARTDGLTDVHRPSDGIDLRNIFCFETTRRIYNDYTITLDGQFIQLETSRRSPLPPPGRSVTVRRWLDGSLHIFWHDAELSFKLPATKPRRKPRVPQPPAPSHPWRHYTLGKARYA